MNIVLVLNISKWCLIRWENMILWDLVGDNSVWRGEERRAICNIYV